MFSNRLFKVKELKFANWDLNVFNFQVDSHTLCMYLVKKHFWLEIFSRFWKLMFLKTNLDAANVKASSSKKSKSSGKDAKEDLVKSMLHACSCFIKNLAWQMHGRFWTDSRQLSLENLPMITLLMVTWPLGGDESTHRKSQTNRLSSSLLW